MKSISEFSVEYLDMSGKEIQQSTPPDEVAAVSITIPVSVLSENAGLGTAMLKGWIDERKDEMTRLIHFIRKSKKEKAQILSPGLPGINVVR